MGKKLNNEHLTFIYIYIFSLFGGVALLVYVFIASHTHRIQAVTTPVNQVPQVLFNSRSFENVKIEGKAYIVYDLIDKRIIASNNETLELPLASLTKIMTAVTATLHKNKEDTITIKPESIEDGYDLGLAKGQTWPLRELLKYTLIISSNDGAEAVADSFGDKNIFLDQMNKDAKNLGLNFFFTDPAGRDLNGKIGGKGTAYDVAKLFGVARENIPEILDATTKKRETVSTTKGKLSGIPNTNQTIESLPGAEASKTGFTDLAGGNLGVIVDVLIGHPVVIVVLGSSREGRFNDMQILYKTLRESIYHN